MLYYMPDISMVAQLCQKLAKTVIAVKGVNWPVPNRY